MNTGWWGLLWFIGKTLFFLFIFIWLRGTLPRLRYDQFMRLGWKVLVPVSLVWIMAVAVIRTGAIQQLSTAQRLVALGVVVGLVLLVSFLLPDKKVAGHQGRAAGRWRLPGAAARPRRSQGRAQAQGQGREPPQGRQRHRSPGGHSHREGG